MQFTHRKNADKLIQNRVLLPNDCHEAAQLPLLPPVLGCGSQRWTLLKAQSQGYGAAPREAQSTVRCSKPGCKWEGSQTGQFTNVDMRCIMLFCSVQGGDG